MDPSTLSRDMELIKPIHSIGTIDIIPLLHESNTIHIDEGPHHTNINRLTHDTPTSTTTTIRPLNTRQRLLKDSMIVYDRPIDLSHKNDDDNAKYARRGYRVTDIHNELYGLMCKHNGNTTSQSNALQRHQLPYACIYIDATWRDLYAAHLYTFQRYRSVKEKTKDLVKQGDNRSENKHQHPIQQQSEGYRRIRFNDENKERQYLVTEINNLIQHHHNSNAASLDSSSSSSSGSSIHILPTLSCRSALDLFLTVKQYPPQSYILLSAINIPDIITVIRAHQLIAVPIDINIDTLLPSTSALESAIERCGVVNDSEDSQNQQCKPSRPRCAAFLYAHIYGRRSDISELALIAKKHGIDVIEDAAEAFAASENFSYPGDVNSDLTFFSFGSIKTNTSFGGAIMCTPDKDVYEAICQLHATWSAQAASEWRKKCVKNTAVMTLLNLPSVSGRVMGLCSMLNIDHKDYVVSMIRGFPDVSSLMSNIRQQPSTPLLRMMLRRFQLMHKPSNQQYSDIGNMKADLLCELLPDSCQIPGLRVTCRKHWLFPVAVNNPTQCIADLNGAGIDAYRGATQLALVPPPAAHELPRDTTSNQPMDISPYPSIAANFMSNVIYLPVHKHVPISHIIRMAYVMHSILPKSDTPTPDQQTLLNQSPAINQIIPSKL